MFKKIKRRRRWKKEMKTVENYTYTYGWAALCQSLQDLLEESFEYIYLPEMERVCYELIETISNLKYMTQTQDREEYMMLKHRVMYMLENRMEEWYI